MSVSLSAFPNGLRMRHSTSWNLDHSTKGKTWN